MITFFINDIAGKGGTERVTCMIANMLSQNGNHSIEILSLHQSQPTLHFELSPKIRLRSLFSTSGRGITRFPATWYKLHHYLKKNDVDIIIDVDGILDLYSIPAATGTQTKVISWEHFNYHTNPDGPHRKISRILAGRYASAIVTLTEQDKHYYENGLGRKLKSQIIAIHNPMQTKYDSAYDSDSHIIVSAGRLTHQKGFDLLIEAARRVLPDHPEWQWYILGEGEQRSELEHLVAQYNLTEQIQMPGMVNINDFLSKASFFVMSSRFEGLPMVLLEAKAHNLPIISFDCQTGPAEIVNNDVNGLLVPPENTNMLSEAVETLINSKEQRIKYSSHAQEGREQFSATHITKQWNALIQSLLA